MMAESVVEFTADDLTELVVLTLDMADASHSAWGNRGRGMTRMLVKLADDLAAVWLAGDEGREADPVEVPAGMLADDDLDVLEDAARRLEGMAGHAREHRPDDAVWSFFIGLLQRQVAAELEVRRGARN